jgi:soluble lytic murein transglycosylase-like protein
VAVRIVRQHRYVSVRLRTVLIPLLLQIANTSFADCIDDAAAFHGVNPLVVRAIASVESECRPDAINSNSNGSSDYGLMQINSSNLPDLARYGVSKNDLFNSCTNAYIGGWILRQKMNRYGNNWTAIGAYNAGDPGKRISYARRVLAKLQQFSLGTAIPCRVPPEALFGPRIQAVSRRASVPHSGRASFIHPSSYPTDGQALGLAVYDEPAGATQ